MKQGRDQQAGAQPNRNRQPQQSQQAQSGQQQQFEAPGGQQSSGAGTHARFADQIREHMQVVDPSGAQVGTVDHVEGDRIKLTRSSSGSGEHQYIPLNQVAGIERDRVRLRERGDTTFGMESEH